jgi:hypothetical protein
MNVYVLMGGFDHEGSRILHIFSDEVAAKEKYAECVRRRRRGDYDYFELERWEVDVSDEGTDIV